jgi:hypothetical protein
MGNEVNLLIRSSNSSTSNIEAVKRNYTGLFHPSQNSCKICCRFHFSLLGPGYLLLWGLLGGVRINFYSSLV